jgi:5-amino-6-(5-phosphoribosylamino)uracil reductase
MTKVISSVAVSVDGFIDDASTQRLMLSSKEDFDDVFLLRARSEAILVGAGTLRADNPSLVTRNEDLARWRQDNGMPPDPIKITVTKTGKLDKSLRFFSLGRGEKIIYCTDASLSDLSDEFNDVATVVSIGSVVTAEKIVRDMSTRGIKSVCVEGGSDIHTMFFSEDQVDELRLAIAPFFVGDMGAPRFVKAAKFPFSKDRRMEVRYVKALGDTVVIYYDLRA